MYFSLLIYFIVLIKKKKKKKPNLMWFQLLISKEITGFWSLLGCHFITINADLGL